MPEEQKKGNIQNKYTEYNSKKRNYAERTDNIYATVQKNQKIIHSLTAEQLKEYGIIR